MTKSAGKQISEYFYSQLAKGNKIDSSGLVSWAKKKKLIPSHSINAERIERWIDRLPLLKRFSRSIRPRHFASVLAYSLGHFHYDLGFYQERYARQNKGFKGFAVFVEKLTLKLRYV